MAFLAGLATFVSALNDPKVGLVLAIAIAIHNIPEGMDSCFEIRESSDGCSPKKFICPHAATAYDRNLCSHACLLCYW